VTNCGPYELLEQAGAGSSGAVFKAVRPPEHEQPFAVKLLESAPPALWLEHMKLMARISSPHLCRFVEAGRCADGKSYIVYQFLPGGDLEAARARFDEGRAPLRTVLRWAIDVLKGLGAMHQAGFLHGDVKPSNLMLDAEGRVVVCDFTTLTPLEGALSMDLRNGTPEYLPQDPSELRSPRRDLYALAMTMTGLLTGRLPQSRQEALPSHTDPLLPAALDDLVGRALGLAGEPFKSAAEMRRAVESLLSGPEPMAASSLSPPTRRVAWQNGTRKAPLWPWLVALLMLPLGVWARHWQLRSEPAPPASTALWSGIGVAPQAYRQHLVWQVLILGRPVLALTGSDPAAADESARERADWCAAVLEEAHFQKRPLKFAYRREFENSCEVYLVGKDWPDKLLFRVTPAESRLFQRQGPFLARAWCALLADTSELARPGSRSGERSAGALLLQPWQRRYETLAGQRPNLDQTTRVALWLEALEGLEKEVHDTVVDAYADLPQEKKTSGR
jgi:serine/threonine protein kinase